MLVGRKSERARIDRLLAGAREGESGVLVLTGEPGIGKSALCGYACAEAGGMRVLRSRSVESEAELAFAALGDLFRPVLDLFDALPPPQKAALDGALAVGPPARGDRLATCAATLSLLAAAAEDAGALLAVVDDAQWLDAPSAEALLFAARRLESEGVALLFACRGGSAAAFDPGGSLPKISLSGLDYEAGGELIEQQVEERPPPAILSRLHDVTAGNPLGLIETVALLSADQLAGAEPLPESLPGGVRLENMLLRSVEELPSNVQQILLIAAASDSGDIATILRASKTFDGIDAIEAAERAGVVETEDGHLEFRHPLLRSAIYQRAAPAARQAAQRTLAESTTDETDAADRRAWHLAAATDGVDVEAARLLDRAGANARDRGGHASAASAFARAASLSKEDGERLRRLVEAGTEARYAGRAEEALARFDEALPLSSNPLERARIQQARGSLEAWRGYPMAAHVLLTEEAARVEALDPRRAAIMLAEAAWPCFMAGEIATGLETAERALALAEPTDEPERALATVILAEASVLHGQARAGAELLEQCRPALDKGLELLGTEQSVGSTPSGRGDPGPDRYRDVIRTILMAAQVLTWLEEYGRARKLLTHVIEKSRAHSLLGTLPFALAALSELDFRTGNWVGAYAGASEGLRLADETKQASGLSLSLVSLARVEAARGLEADCREHTARAFELAGFGVPLSVVYAASCRALLELGLGRAEHAIGHLEQIARSAPRYGLDDPSVVQWAPDLIEAYVRSGRNDDAEIALGIFAEQARSSERTWALGAAARCRGLLANDDEFEGAFDEALDWNTRTDTPFERARTELCYGERLRRARRRVDSRERIRSALETFQRLGATPWVARCRGELGASVETSRRRDEPASNRLTPQELQVALIVAEGRTNREAGAALFLSPKTIETHLSRIYRKLNIRSRTELARLLAGEGALPDSPERATPPST